jgi:hypothetical protein
VGALVDPATEEVTPELMVERHRERLRKLSDRRLYLPAEEPYLEGHNTWCVNVPGSPLVIPVADIAQHVRDPASSEAYQIHPFSRAIRYASAREPASSFWVIVAR